MGPSEPDRKLTVEMPISVPINQMVSHMKVGVHVVALEGLNIKMAGPQTRVLGLHVLR